MGIRNRARRLRDKAGRFKSKAGQYKIKAKKKLKGLIPSRHMAKWKLIAEGSLAVIIIVGLFEIAHYFFHVHFEEEFLIALEAVDYFAVFILGVDLFHHYLVAPRKEKFLQNKFIYILSFIPYLIFHKALAFLAILRPLKPIFTGIAKIIKLTSHKKEIKEKIDGITEDVSELTQKTKSKKKIKK